MLFEWPTNGCYVRTVAPNKFLKLHVNSGPFGHEKQRAKTIIISTDTREGKESVNKQMAQSLVRMSKYSAIR